MTAKTAAISVDETASTEAIRAALDEAQTQIASMTQRRVDLLSEPAKIGEYIELGGLLDVENARIDKLRMALKTASQREALADFEQRVIDLHGLYSRAADLDQRILDARAALTALVEQRSKLEYEELNVVSGRRSKAWDVCSSLRVDAELIHEIIARYKVPGYM